MSCVGQNNDNTGSQQTADVEVYYFHFTRRCATCKTVESEAKKAVQELYGDAVQFLTYNLDKNEGEQKADDLGVSGQTLLIVKDETKINITRAGFMNARNNPDKLKQIIKNKIDPLMK
jgi:hypothetical protein